MNPEAGFIKGAFRDEVVRIAKANPKLTANDVIRLARGQQPIEPERKPGTPTLQGVEEPMEFQFT